MIFVLIRRYQGQVVDDFSSKLDLLRPLETVESIDTNHIQMARCSSKEDTRYRAISGVLKQYIRKEILYENAIASQEASVTPLSEGWRALTADERNQSEMVSFNIVGTTLHRRAGTHAMADRITGNESWQPCAIKKASSSTENHLSVTPEHSNTLPATDQTEGHGESKRLAPITVAYIHNRSSLLNRITANAKQSFHRVNKHSWRQGYLREHISAGRVHDVLNQRF